MEQMTLDFRTDRDVTKYKVGQFFKRVRFDNPYNREAIFVLAQVDNSAVALIHLESGNRYNNPIEVDRSSLTHGLTPYEWLKVAVRASDFTPIKIAINRF